MPLSLIINATVSGLEDKSDQMISLTVRAPVLSHLPMISTRIKPYNVQSIFTRPSLYHFFLQSSRSVAAKGEVTKDDIFLLR